MTGHPTGVQLENTVNERAPPERTCAMKDGAVKPRLRVQEHERRAMVGHAHRRDSIVHTSMVQVPGGMPVHAELGQESTVRSGWLGNLQLWLGEPTGLLEPQAAGMGNHG